MSHSASFKSLLNVVFSTIQNTNFTVKTMEYQVLELCEITKADLLSNFKKIKMDSFINIKYKKIPQKKSIFESMKFIWIAKRYPMNLNN